MHGMRYHRLLLASVALFVCTHCKDSNKISTPGDSNHAVQAPPTPPPTAVTVGAAVGIAVQTQPLDFVAGQALDTVKVAIVDQNGQVVTDWATAITASILGDRPAVLSGTLTQTPALGVATFSGLSATVAGQFQLVFASGSLAGQSQGFSVQSASVAKLGFQPPPLDNYIGGIIDVIAVALDAYGNPVTNAAGEVVLSLDSNGGTGQLLGLAQRPLVNGAVNFTDLSINGLGDYHFHLSSGSLTTDSNVFAIVEPRWSYMENLPGAPYKLFLSYKDPNQLLVMFTSNGTIYGSSDNGNTWLLEGFNFNGRSDYTVSPQDFNYHFTNETLSVNGGNTFTAVDAAPIGFSADGNSILGWGGSYLRKSIDKGGTWAPLFALGAPDVMAAAALSPNSATMYAVAASGRNFTTRDGNNWVENEPIQIPSNSPLQMYPDPASPATIYLQINLYASSTGNMVSVLRSTDFGATWNAVVTPLGRLEGFTVAATQPTTTLYATGESRTIYSPSQVVASTDGGATWVNAGMGLPTEADCHGLMASFAVSRRVYVNCPSAANGIYVTETGGL